MSDVKWGTDAVGIARGADRADDGGAIADQVVDYLGTFERQPAEIRRYRASFDGEATQR
jgi:hypothetical protein